MANTSQIGDIITSRITSEFTSEPSELSEVNPSEFTSELNKPRTQTVYGTYGSLVDELSDLTNDKFRDYYRKRFKELGVSRVMELAAVARNDGKQPRQLFSYLLKRGSTV